MSSVFVQVLVNFRGGGENLSLVTVSSTASTETHHLRSPKLHHFLLVNLIRLLMFQKECQFFCISSKAVQQFAHMITVTITCCQNDNRDIKNRVQQFSICSMPYTNKHLYMAYCIWSVVEVWSAARLQRGGWRRRNWQGSWKQFSNYALCQ